MTNDFYCDEVLNGKTAVEKVIETGRVLAYHHTRPFWEVHIVVIPKQHIESLLTLDDPSLMLEIMQIVQQVAQQVSEDQGGCHIVTNLGKYQESKHLHWHIASGERVSQPS